MCFDDRPFDDDDDEEWWSDGLILSLKGFQQRVRAGALCCFASNKQGPFQVLGASGGTSKQPACMGGWRSFDFELRQLIHARVLDDHFLSVEIGVTYERTFECDTRLQDGGQF